MTNQLTKASFDSLDNRFFTAYLADNLQTTLELTEVKGLTERVNPQTNQAARVQPFSLLFCGSAEMPLRQSIFPLQHPEFAQLINLFLVPVGSDERGLFYEAIFN